MGNQTTKNNNQHEPHELNVLFCDVNGVIIANDSSTQTDATNYVKFCLADKIAYPDSTTFITLNDESKKRFGKDKKARIEWLDQQLKLLEPIKASDLMDGVQQINGLSFFKSFLSFFETFPLDQWKVVLRTFGHDGKDVLKTLISLSKNSQQLVEVYLRCGKDGEYYNETTNELLTPPIIENFLKTCPSIVLVHDDPDLWLTHNEKRCFGKPIFGLPNLNYIFLDDNITTSEETNIVNLLQWNQQLKKWEPKTMKDDNKILKVDRYDALFKGHFERKLASLIPLNNHLRESTMVSCANENA